MLISPISYNLVQAAYLGKAGIELSSQLGIQLEDDVLFAVFSTSEYGGTSKIPAQVNFRMENIVILIIREKELDKNQFEYGGPPTFLHWLILFTLSLKLYYLISLSY